MADIAESGSNPKEMENVRKSTRLRQQSRFEKSMSIFTSRGKRNASADSSSDEADHPVPEKRPNREVIVKRRGPKLAARLKERPKVVEKKKPPTSSEDEPEEEEEERPKPMEVEMLEEEEIVAPSFSLSMLNLRRVGDTTPLPKKDKEPVQLNRRGMPQRIRKKNRLFFDDNVVTPPMVKPRIKKETPVKPKEEKRPVHHNRGRPRLIDKREKEEEVVEKKPPPPPPVVSTSDVTKEGNAVRQRIGMTLRNLLKLPKAQRWVFYEWFYSNIDRVLFFGNNDFLMCLKENFPNLKTCMMRKTEWCVLRRLLGKPRRCSQAFFQEERRTLEKRRNQIRAIQQRKLRDLNNCKEIPERIPLHLSVNSRVTARLRKPQAGLFTGKVDAVDPSNHTYRITFDRPGIGTHSIPDYEVLLEGEPDVMSLSSLAKRYSTAKHMPKPGIRNTVPDSRPDFKLTWADNITAKFPKSFYEMIVRICKILKEKRQKVGMLKAMNAEAERMVTLSQEYPEDFQKRYASIIIDLESLNISLERFLTTVQKHCHELAPDVSYAAMLAPSYIREKSLAEATAMVDNFLKEKQPLKNENLVQLIIELIALIIQVQTLSESKHSTHELQILKQSIAKIKTMISPKNLLEFQNKVEIHIQFIESTLSQKGHLSSLLTYAPPAAKQT